MTPSKTIKIKNAYIAYIAFIRLVTTLLLFFALLIFASKYMLWVKIIIAVVTLRYIYRLLYMKSVTYKLTNEQLILEYGVFSKTIKFIELYRVKDFVIDKPFVLRLIHAINLKIFTSDRTSPALLMMAIEDDDLPYELRELVENNRVRKGVFEVDSR